VGDGSRSHENRVTSAAASSARTAAATLPRRGPGMMLMRIERWDVRTDGPLNDGTLRQKLDALGYGAAVALDPVEAVGTARPEGSERVEAVVSGLIKVTINGESAILTAGDVVFVPRGAVRRVEAVGVSAASSIRAVYRTTP
jgi:mannose-6-phosphate isomerase-like protein (cupin superfamily)